MKVTSLYTFDLPSHYLIILIIIIFHTCSQPADSDIYAPRESPHKHAYYRFKTPPEGFTAVLGWLQAIDINGSGEKSKVEVDWMRVYASSDTDSILFVDEFDLHLSGMDDYGLYLREPWFEGDKQDSMPYALQNGSLIVEPSLYPENVFHWWNTSRSIVPQNTERIWYQARIRITGGAGVQAGIDYWKDLSSGYNGLDVNNTEAGVSDWYGSSTDGWQIISVGQP